MRRRTEIKPYSKPIPEFPDPAQRTTRPGNPSRVDSSEQIVCRDGGASVTGRAPLELRAYAHRKAPLLHLQSPLQHWLSATQNWLLGVHGRQVLFRMPPHTNPLQQSALLEQLSSAPEHGVTHCPSEQTWPGGQVKTHVCWSESQISQGPQLSMHCPPSQISQASQVETH